MPAPPTGRQVFGVYQFQSAFATFPTTGNWQTLSAYDLSAGETRGFENDPMLGRGGHNGRDPYQQAPALPTGAGPIRVPLCLREFGWWLKLALGAPVTVDASPNYTHTFKSGAAELPTLAQSKFITANDYRRVRGLSVNGLRVNFRKEGGYPIIDLDTLLRDEALAATQATGTIVPAPTLLRPPKSKAIGRWNSVAIGDLLAFDLNYSNNLTPFNPLSGSEYPEGFDAGDTSFTMSMTMRYRDQTWAAIADAQTSQLLEAEIAIDANKLITFAFPKPLLARQPIAISGPGVMDVTFNVTVEQQASEAAMIVTLKNDVAGYPAA